MHGINRRGQKIVCIASVEVICAICGLARVPEENGVYTVRDFGEFDTRGLGGMTKTEVCIPGVFLDEVPDIASCPCVAPEMAVPMKPLPWPLVLFKPVFEGKTDISEIVRNGLDVPVADRILETVSQDEFSDFVASHWWG